MLLACLLALAQAPPITPGMSRTRVLQTDGTELVGELVAVAEAEIVLRVEGRLLVVPRVSIASMTPTDASPDPAASTVLPTAPAAPGTVEAPAAPETAWTPAAPEAPPAVSTIPEVAPAPEPAAAPTTGPYWAPVPAVPPRPEPIALDVEPSTFPRGLLVGGTSAAGVGVVTHLIAGEPPDGFTTSPLNTFAVFAETGGGAAVLTGATLERAALRRQGHRVNAVALGFGWSFWGLGAAGLGVANALGAEPAPLNVGSGLMGAGLALGLVQTLVNR